MSHIRLNTASLFQSASSWLRKQRNCSLTSTARTSALMTTDRVRRSIPFRLVGERNLSVWDPLTYHVQIRVCYLLANISFPLEFSSRYKMCNYFQPLYLLPLLHHPNRCQDIDIFAANTFCIPLQKEGGPKDYQGLALSMMIDSWAPDTENIQKSSFFWTVRNSIDPWTKLGE